MKDKMSKQEVLMSAIFKNKNLIREYRSNHSESLGQFILVVIVCLIVVTNVRLITVISKLSNELDMIEIQLQRVGIFLQPNHPRTTNLSIDSTVDVSWIDAPTLGALDAPVQIVEFGDLQCPFCAASRLIIDQIFNKYEGQVLFAYRHFPLPGHPEAIPAAEAVECAKEQNKFWEMYELLLSKGQELSSDLYLNLAEQLHLDITQFQTCLSDGRYINTILNDLEDGKAYGVTGTPTFFINGHMVQGASDLQRFEEVIEEILTSTQTQH